MALAAAVDEEDAGTSGAPPGPDVRPVPQAGQQPGWRDVALLEEVRDDLRARPGLTRAEDVARLRRLLAEVAAGRRRVVQAGDCAEDPAECTPGHVAGKAAMLDALAGAVQRGSGRAVLRVGRLAGQFAKPRSQEFEQVEGRELPVYRGPMVNGPEPDATARAPDPRRLVTGYELSSAVTAALALHGRGPAGDSAVWTSHEALLLDYERSLVRDDGRGGRLLASTHLPWIGERTRQPGGAHVQLLAQVVNPVACKIGPDATTDEVLALCAALDPHRKPGRLTLIARMGAGRVLRALPPMVRTVREAGHPVVWLCDPVHGNTIRTSDGRKTRAVTAVVREVEGFQDAVIAERGVAGGLHLEATPAPVGECVGRPGDEPDGPSTTLCDPRLNLSQALEVASAWRV